MMYLTTDAREKLRSAFEAALRPMGVFFFGTTESFSIPSKLLRRCHFNNTFFYEKQGC